MARRRGTPDHPDTDDDNYRERLPNQEQRRRRNPDPEPGGDDPEFRYSREDKEGMEQRRLWLANEIWTAVRDKGLNLTNTDALASLLSSLGVLDQKEEGRHLRRMFLDKSGAYGYGNAPGGYSSVLDVYKPNWRRNTEYDMEKYGRPTEFDAYGRTNPNRPSAKPQGAVPMSPHGGTPMSPQPEGIPAPPPLYPNDTPARQTPTFYGGSTAPNAYGVSPSQLINRPQARSPMGVSDGGGQGTSGTDRQNLRAPAWFGQWRF